MTHRDAPEVGGLGPRVVPPAKPQPTHRPAPGIEADKCIEVDSQGRLRTNDPRNEPVPP